MAAVTAAQVKALRERTGLGLMACKKALQDTGGDADRAIVQLRQAGSLLAKSKSARSTGEGVVAVRVAEDRAHGAVVEVNCETDFVAKGEDFLGFVDQALALSFARPQDFQDDAGALLDEALREEREALTQKVGENVRVRRAAWLRAPAEDGFVAGYVHGNGRIGVLVAVSAPADAGEASPMAKELAMHVAAMDPWVLEPEHMPAEALEAERAIYAEQARSSGKPDEIVEKMVAGKLRKFVAQHSLSAQPFVKDPDVAVGDWLRRPGMAVTAFRRYAVGEEAEAWRM